MKFQHIIFFLFCIHCGVAQSIVKPPISVKFKSCKTQACKISNAFLTAEYYLEADDIQSSQQWLNKTKDFLNPELTDSTACFVHSLQSELFYYNNLFQFGIDEARKEIITAKKNNDSLLVADGYFFLGINQIELNELPQAQQSLWKSRKYFPKSKSSKHLRNIIQNEHIFNNLAQVKSKLHQTDSAFWYNKKAHAFAVAANSKRGIPNTEQTFGEIYLSNQWTDSAAVFFNKSIESAYKSNYYDTVLLNYGFLIECYKNQPKLREQYFQKGLELMRQHIVNASFKKYFYTKALSVFKLTDAAKTIFLQNHIIEIDDKTQAQGNWYIQHFTDQYISHEKKLLALEVLKLKKQKDIVLFQLLVALLAVVVLALLVMHIRRKNKISTTLLNQKNEISKDLHDDIGSGISSILIHSDLLQKNPETDPKQKVLLDKISVTSREVSQRINTFVWSLDPENNTFQNFMEYLKLYAENLFEGTSIELEFIEQQKADTSFLIEGKTRKNLFFSIKELLNNALKHSQANKISIRIAIPDRKNLFVEVRDNGIGISRQHYFGNGLKNIQKRVEEMNGTLQMETQNGLLTRIQIPLRF
ncbi:ATP-binding protein [Flavobacterium sp.]|uniref:ATP-binding protein n=1 Tax=Flavobacterium sp. TaxID=239 RepID=UPI0026106E9B|nr:ATP-binding protein [Flavobacterium sp.]